LAKAILVRLSKFFSQQLAKLGEIYQSATKYTNITQNILK
jgi:hypothetical protein